MNNKIFQIGFNKCGTSSIHTLFDKYTTPRLRSIHWKKGLLAQSMFHKMKTNKLLISDEYNQYDIFTDMETIFIANGSLQIIHMYEYFKILDDQYPNSKFIFNIRNIDDWIESRLKHEVKSILIENSVVNLKKPILYWKIYSKIFKELNKTNIIELWKSHWQKQHNLVVQYFSHRPQDLLVYNIDTDKTLDKFKNFFPNLNFTINALPLVNKTKI
jgi:hypothetical protein